MARRLAFLLCLVPLLCRGAENGAPPAGDDLKVMRAMLEQQSKQLDVLAQEIARLNLLLEARNPGPAAASPTENATLKPSAPASEPAIPKAEPADSTAPTGPVHLVAKGDTLAVIAKRYKVPVSELMKVNKITDPRKLQIGQVLKLPAGARLEQESPSPSPQQ